MDEGIARLQKKITERQPGYLMAAVEIGKILTELKRQSKSREEGGRAYRGFMKLMLAHMPFGNNAMHMYMRAYENWKVIAFYDMMTDALPEFSELEPNFETEEEWEEWMKRSVIHPNRITIPEGINLTRLAGPFEGIPFTAEQKELIHRVSEQVEKDFSGMGKKPR